MKLLIQQMILDFMQYLHQNLQGEMLGLISNVPKLTMICAARLEDARSRGTRSWLSEICPTDSNYESQ